MLQFLFEIFSKPKILSLDDLGYETVEKDFMKESDLMLLGLIRYTIQNPNPVHCKMFRKQHNHLTEYLFVNSMNIIHTLFIGELMVYKKAHTSEKTTLLQQYPSILKLLPDFQDKAEMYQKANKNDIVKVGKYVHERMIRRGYHERYDTGCFTIQAHDSLKHVYHLIDDSGEIKKDVKVIGDNIYRLHQTSVEPLELNLGNIGIEFEPVKSFWLTEADDEHFQKESVIELNFNDNRFFYMKAEKYDEENPRVNIVLFEMLTNVDVTKISLTEVIEDDEQFKKILLMEERKMVTSFLMYTIMKRKFLNSADIRKWWIGVMCRECVKESTRKELGFKLEGPLDGDELLVVEAMVI